MNTFMNELEKTTNFTTTTNGATAHKSTLSKVYDLFAFGGAYRNRSEADCINLFKNAYEEDSSMALKCLFYLVDVRGGQGERRFFRVCFAWLCNEHPEVAFRLVDKIPFFSRWDNILYAIPDSATYVKNEAYEVIKTQLALDMDSKTPSLMGKWLPSENASAQKTKNEAHKLRKYLGYSHKEYRQILSALRKKINVLERLMSSNQWDKIEFDKIPSKAGLIYKNAFARNDITSERYKAFAANKNTKVNASTLYPYDVVKKAIDFNYSYGFYGNSETDRNMINKYWENLPDYLNGADCKMLCVCDTSGSMRGGAAAAPINVAIGLSMYCAERIGGPFKNHYISFSSRPQLIETKGVDFVDKVKRIYDTNLCENTNLVAVFNLLKDTALKANVKKEDMPETIVVISDMEIDAGTSPCCWRKYNDFKRWTTKSASTEMEKIREEWAAAGLTLPRIVYWNVNATTDIILDSGPDVTFVSGASPIIFKSVITGKTGIDIMLEVLLNDRYANIF